MYPKASQQENTPDAIFNVQRKQVKDRFPNQQSIILLIVSECY